LDFFSEITEVPIKEKLLFLNRRDSLYLG